MTQDTRKKRRPEPEYVVELESPSRHRLVYALGALGGLALGVLLKRGLEGLTGREETEDRDEGAPASRFNPLRPRRAPRDPDGLLVLEDAVLDAFLGDSLLSERSVELGVISHGIVELSGSVLSRAEAMHAVAVAQAVEGVSTVVNRLEIEEERERPRPRFDTRDEGFAMSGAEWTGHQSGMGRRRQGDQTDPSRPDDSHALRERALEQADRAQFADEGHFERPRMGDAHDGPAPNPTRYREDELDNQSPFGKRAVPQGSPDGPPQAFNSQARVGEGLKPGVELGLEAEDLPLKPHQHASPNRDRDV